MAVVGLVAWVTLVGSGLVCLARIMSRFQAVPGGVQVMRVRVGSGVGARTLRSVGSTTLTSVTL